MKAIRENVPFIIGCIAYYAGLTTLNALIWLGASSFVISRSFSQPSDFVLFLLGFSVRALSGYVSFLASVRWIISPILKRTKNVMEKVGGFLLVEWLLFSLLVYMFGSLPLSLLPVFPQTAELQTAIGYIWMAIVSFSFYKAVVAGHAFSSPKKAVSESDSQAKMA